MWIEHKIFESHENNYLLSKWFILEAEMACGLVKACPLVQMTSLI